jgi:hypothetical protein
MSIKQSLPLLALLLIQTLSVASVKEHIVSLEYQYTEIKNFGFHIEKVINATGNERLIGFVQKKINYQNVPAFFAHEISVEIAGFLKVNMMKSQGDIPLFVRVDRVHISESYNGINETAIAKVNLTFITRTEDNVYYKLLTARVVEEKSASMGITKSQPELIAKAIAHCFSDLYDRYKQGYLSFTKISEEELYNNLESDEVVSARLLSLKRNKAGIYRTLYDFQNNTPDTAVTFEITYKTKQHKGDLLRSAKVQFPENYEDSKDIWGFCDGQQNFIRINNNKFIPLEKDEEGYYLMIKVYDNVQMYYAGFLGGLIGTGIAAAATPKSKVRLNILTGRFDVSDINENVSDYSKAAKVVFYASRYNASSAPLEIIVDDSIHCKLPPNTWYEYATDALTKSVIVKVRSENGLETMQQITTKPFETIMYLCITHKKKPPSVNKITANNRKDYESVMTNDNRVFPTPKDNKIY